MQSRCRHQQDHRHHQSPSSPQSPAASRIRNPRSPKQQPVRDLFAVLFSAVVWFVVGLAETVYANC
eukprot:7721692-Prorocentrum_lima.AAC.1